MNTKLIVISIAVLLGSVSHSTTLRWDGATLNAPAGYEFAPGGTSRMYDDGMVLARVRPIGSSSYGTNAVFSPQWQWKIINDSAHWSVVQVTANHIYRSTYANNQDQLLKISLATGQTVSTWSFSDETRFDYVNDEGTSAYTTSYYAGAHKVHWIRHANGGSASFTSNWDAGERPSLPSPGGLFGHNYFNYDTWPNPQVRYGYVFRLLPNGATQLVANRDNHGNTMNVVHYAADSGWVLAEVTVPGSNFTETRVFDRFSVRLFYASDSDAIAAFTLDRGYLLGGLTGGRLTVRNLQDLGAGDFRQYSTGLIGDEFVASASVSRNGSIVGMAVSASTGASRMMYFTEAVPEPASLAALGIGVVAFLRKRKNARK